jgi:uncharacterized protein
MPVAYESDPATEKLAKLEEWFKAVGGPVVVAFSGGVDSSVVLAAAARALGPSQVYAVTADSPIHPRSELEWAKRVAALLGVNHVIITTSELEDENFASNPPLRCYYCKKAMVQQLKSVAERVGAKVVVDGTNSEDLGGRRPGYLALREEGVRSPLAELGFTKSEVRRAAKLLGLPNWDKPPMACLATRIPYGQRITLERLKRIEAAEEAVRALTGARQVRVRDHGDIARIEVGRGERRLLFSEEVMDEVARRLKQLGWRYVALDLEGYRSGSMDEGLADKLSPKAQHAV